MNSLAVDVFAMVTEPQLNSYCAILTLHDAIKIDASILAQYISTRSMFLQSLRKSSILSLHVNYNCANPIFNKYCTCMGPLNEKLWLSH
jgi:hypothetical protein